MQQERIDLNFHFICRLLSNNVLRLLLFVATEKYMCKRQLRLAPTCFNVCLIMLCILMEQVNPNSGPYQGGTNVTISGTDLGVVVDDIINITIGGAPCMINTDSYLPGER